MRNLTIIVAAMLLLAACEHADPLETGGLQPTLASIQTNIFNQNCALSGCHAGSNAQLGLDLSAGNARESLVGVASASVPSLMRIDPGNPDDSYLVIKIEGDDPRLVGGRMPLNMPALTSEEIGIVREWIEDGAE